MGRVCEHELHKGTEYDLYARLGLTLAYHKIKKIFVIKNISDDQIKYKFERLENAVRMCNDLEGAQNTTVGCNNFCSEKKRPVFCEPGEWLTDERFCDCGHKLEAHDGTGSCYGDEKGGCNCKHPTTRRSALEAREDEEQRQNVETAVTV